MDISVRTYWTPKEGNSPFEYEDAFCVHTLDGPEAAGSESSGEGSVGRNYIARFAVADGASESMLSGPWARVLVKVFCRLGWHPVVQGQEGVLEASVGAALNRAYCSWQLWRDQYLRARENRGKPVQWYEEPGLRAGAYATLLGLELVSAGDDEARCPPGSWTAVAAGDSCLFQVRGCQLVTVFPVEKSSEFGTSPPLICSKPRPKQVPFAAAAGWLAKGDRLYLMTDALAAWFLACAERGETPWRILDALGNPRESMFEELVKDLRRSKKLRNDDITLIRIEVT